MGIFQNGLVSVIKEASGSDAFYSDNVPFSASPSEDDIETSDILDDIINGVEDIEELEDDIEYTEESISVMFDAKKDRYLIEFDNLAKYMTSAKVVSVKEAVDKICAANSIESSKTYVVIESQQEIVDFVNEAKSVFSKGSSLSIAGKKSKKLDLDKASQALTAMRNLKVNLLKKKSKKK